MISENIKKGQVTIFIIVAIILVFAVVIFFFYRESIFKDKVPATISPVYSSFLDCVEEDTLLGVDILGTQSGHIYVNELEFSPGSAYMPFSSQLDFYGNAVPYWYYVSGNNIQKEEIPAKSDMEGELERFVEEQIVRCNLDRYKENGYKIENGEPKVDVKINSKNIEINLDMDLNIRKGDDKYSVASHKKTVKTNFGKLYDIARDVYDYEQDTLFLENYGVDTLRNYAPVDGVEFSCKPETWIALNVSETLKDAIEANTQALRVKGKYYDLSKDENKYFVVDVGDDLSNDYRVNFMNSRYWPYAFDVSPTQGDILIANPVGNQEGLGILGFCYVPYHFVYDLKYPILVQVMDESADEVFQFPVAVVIQGNKPREPLEGNAADLGDVELCQYANQEVEVRTYNTNLNSVDADISFNCLGSRCNIGGTFQGRLTEYFPQCVNGFVIAKAEGYETAQYLVSTNVEDSVDIILDKLYEVDIDLLIDGRSTSKEAIISFAGDNKAKTIIYPEQRSVELSQGLYDIKVQVFDDSSLTIGATTTKQCYEVSRGAVGGFFGITKQECVDIEYPEQVVSQVLIAGGEVEYFILESELINARTIEIDTESLIKPNSIEAINTNYNLFENRILGVKFK